MNSVVRSSCIFGCVVLLTQMAMAQQPPTVEEVIEGLERYEKMFFESKSMFVCYERTKCEDLTQTAASGGLLPAEWTLAYRGGKWFNQRRFTQPTTIKGVAVPAEPKKCVAKNRYVLQWDAAGTNAFIDRFSQSLDIYAGLYFTRNIFLDTPAHIAKAGGVAKDVDIQAIRKQYADDADHPFLPEFLRKNKAQYRVLLKPEQVDGVLCWVVEWPGMDRFCVAVDRGFAIPQRKYCWGPDKPPRFEFHNSDYREVKPGLWLPFTQVVDRYASIIAEKEPLWGKVASRSEYKVKAVHFDDVPDKQFDIDIPQGVLVFDAARNFTYTVCGKDTADPFTMPVIKGRQLLEEPGRKSTLIITSSLLIVAVTCLVWRRRRKRN
ncbi:MAG: hypothetical protein ABFC77_02560 [Thermoguttaceae bacterium]